MMSAKKKWPKLGREKTCSCSTKSSSGLNSECDLIEYLQNGLVKPFTYTVDLRVHHLGLGVINSSLISTLPSWYTHVCQAGHNIVWLL